MNKKLVIVLHPNMIKHLKKKGWCPDYATASTKLLTKPAREEVLTQEMLDAALKTLPEPLKSLFTSLLEEGTPKENK